MRPIRLTGFKARVQGYGPLYTTTSMENVMTNDLTVLRHEGRNKELFLAIETVAGTTEQITEEITVPEGAAFISVFLTWPDAEGFKRVEDVGAKLISPADAVYGESEMLPAEGRDTDTVEISTTRNIGQIIYLAKPAAGKWTIELDAKAANPFSCEIRVLPEMSAAPSSDQAAARSFVDFGKSLPRTMIINRVYEELERQDSFASALADCQTCQTAMMVALIAFGIAALVVAAVLLFFFPPAVAVAKALALLGLVLVVDFIIGIFMRIVEEILDNPTRAVTLLSYQICKDAGACR